MVICQAHKQLVDRTTEVLKAAFRKSIVARPELEFFPIFNFVYRDTHKMVTLGGMIGGRAERRLLRASTLDDTVYHRADFNSDPCQITVPRLTRKERVYLDREMPGTTGWTPKEFDLDSEETERYREIYRFLPAFAEILL